jgi:hypothetical protein
MDLSSLLWHFIEQLVGVSSARPERAYCTRRHQVSAMTPLPPPLNLIFLWMSTTTWKLTDTFPRPLAPVAAATAASQLGDGAAQTTWRRPEPTSFPWL